MANAQHQHRQQGVAKLSDDAMIADAVALQFAQRPGQRLAKLARIIHRGAIRVALGTVSPIALTPGIQAWSQSDPEQYQQVLSGISLRRLGDPEHHIAPAVAFLASDEARYITDPTLLVDGGSIMLH